MKCQNNRCTLASVEAVPVTNDGEVGRIRLCDICVQAYRIGAEYAKQRALRRLAKSIPETDVPSMSRFAIRLVESEEDPGDDGGAVPSGVS